MGRQEKKIYVQINILSWSFIALYIHSQDQLVGEWLGFYVLLASEATFMARTICSTYSVFSICRLLEQ